MAMSDGKMNRRTAYAPKGGGLRPAQLGPGSVLAAAMRPPARRRVAATLQLFESDPIVRDTLDFYRWGEATFGDRWRCADILTTLQEAAELLRPEAYLEIGVLTGRSLAVVARAAPASRIVGFDLWQESYAGIEGAQPARVRERLSRVGHRGELTLVAGPSAETVPSFLAANPELHFDLVTVDGDHSVEGARTDLENVLGRVKIGGMVVFDDVRHPAHPGLERVWEVAMACHPAFVSAVFEDAGSGVGVAMRGRWSDRAEGSVCPVLLTDAPEVELVDWTAWYSPEPVDGEQQLWLPAGPGGLTLTLVAKEPRRLLLRAYATPGPDAGQGSRKLIVRSRVDTSTVIEGAGWVSLPLQLAPGINQVMVGVEVRSGERPASPAGDKRDLALCLGHLRLGALDREPVTSPGD